jgi:hypothetical protein
MALTNNLRKQVDLPVWEWCRLAPGVSSAVSASCAADNSLYHVTFGRYIYYMQAAATLATTTGLTGFFRYDTISDSYQLLAQPPLAPTAYTGMQFAGGQGYSGLVISNGGGSNTLEIPGLTGQTLKGFDIRIIEGTGDGQQRTITAVSDPVIWDNGTVTAAATSPQGNITDSNKNWIINQWVGYQVRFVSSSGQSVTRKIIYNSATTLHFADVAKFAEDPWAWSPVTTIAGSAQVIAVAASTIYQIESSVLMVDSDWLVKPDTTSRFVVRGGGIWMLSQGATYTLQYYDVLADQWYIRNAGAATSPVMAIGTDGTIINSGENATVWERGTAVGAQTTTTLKDTSKSWTTDQWAGYYVRIFSGTGEDQFRKITSNTSDTLTVPTWTTITPDTTTKYFIESYEMGTLTSVGAMTQTGVSTGTINGSVFTAGTTTGKYYPGQILSGTGVQSTTTILSAPAACYTTGLVTTINFASGNPTTMGITAGMVVSLDSIVGLPGQVGTGVLAAGNPTYVVTVGTSSITVNIAPTTALLNATLRFSTAWVTPLAAHTNNGQLITLAGGATTTGLYPGMYITIGAGTGVIPVGTYVAQVIDSTKFTLSQNPSTALSGLVWLLGQGYHTILQEQLSGLPGGAGTYRVFPSQIVASTTITGTGVATVTDNTKSWPKDRWNNYCIRIKSGTGKGQVRHILDTVSDGTVAYTSAAGATNVGATITVTNTTNLAVNQLLNVISGTGAFAYGTFVKSIINGTTFIASAAPTTTLAASAVVTGTLVNTLKIYPNWDVTPDNTSVYVIHGDSDKNFFSTAAQTPTFIHNIDKDLVTTGRKLEQGVTRGLCATGRNPFPIALSSMVPVLNITGGYGFIAGVATTATTASGNIATITLTTSAASGIFPVGSWITVAGVTPTAYNGTWQVTASSIGSVSFYSTTATGAQTVAGTVAQAASINLGVGTLAGGNWTAFGAATTLTLTGCVPTTYNGTLTVACGASGTTGTTFGGYQSAAGATSSGTTITVTDTVGLMVGAIPTITAGTGTFAAGTVVTGITNATTFTINNAPSVALSGGATVITVVPSVAFTATTPVGSLVTLGVAQKVPQASTAMTGAGGTVTLTTSRTIFPVGSWIVVTGAAPGTYNGIFQVTGGTPGTNVTYANTTTTTATTQCLVGIATRTQLVTTVNNHIFQTGDVLSHSGDQGYSAATNNVSGAITVMTPAVGTPATQYTYPVAAPAAQAFVYGQTTTSLCDGAKNWIPNQWAGCQVTYNSTQMTGVATPVQSTVLTAYILANTTNTLIFAAAHSAAPVQGISRYIITAPETAPMGHTLGSQDSGVVRGVQLVTQIQDVTKSWLMPPFTGITATSITVTTGNTAVITGSMTGITVGMPVAITAGTCTLAAGTVVSAIAGTTVTMSNLFGGSGTTATFTFGAAIGVTGTTITVGAATVVITGSMAAILPGMTAIITLGGVTLPAGTTVSSISGTTVTMSQNFGGSGTTATFTFIPTASSSGNVVTVSGYPLTNLAPGMKLAVTSTANRSTSVLSTGAFVRNGGTNFTPVTVVSITGPNTFTISAVPVVPLVNATVNATFWVPNQWIGRRVRITSGATISNSTVCEAVVASNTTNILTFASIGTAPTHGTNGYAILQQPVVRGLGTALYWNFGGSNALTQGKYLYQARGGNLPGFDRLNLTTDKWEFLMPTPTNETFNTGAMYAYDGEDRIYFTIQVTQRVYYLDLENNSIHAAGQYPYVAGTAIVGNRMEIFETPDGLRYLWLNRHSFQECYRQLLFY